MNRFLRNDLTAKETKIRARVARLTKLGAMRPGTLTVQYRNPSERKTPFHQIRYTHKGRSRSEYVRPENLPAVRREIQTYKTFRRLVDEIIDLSLEASRLRHQRRKALRAGTLGSSLRAGVV